MIDTGTRRVVYVETMAGMFDAVEVRLGRRCGDYYPVLAGLDSGAARGDRGGGPARRRDAAEPERRRERTSVPGREPSRDAPAARRGSAPSGRMTEQLIARQKVCPVTGEPLWTRWADRSRLVVDGRVVFICCKGCEKSLRQKPAKYLPKLPK